MQDSPESEREQLYRAVIGPKGQDYYLSRFRQFDQRGKAGAGWHWPNLFFTFFWLLYRKQWLPALIYYVLPELFLLAIGLLSLLAGPTASGFLPMLYLPFFAGMLLLPPLYADAFYYRRCQAKIRRSERKAGSSLEARLAWLEASGGISHAMLGIAMALAVVFGLGMLSAIVVPAYQDYSTRARVSDILSANQGYADAIGRYYQAHRVMPATLADSGYAAKTQPETVRAVEYDNLAGAITFTLSMPEHEGKTLTLAPIPDGKGRMRWICSSTLPDASLPENCRRQGSSAS